MTMSMESLSLSRRSLLASVAALGVAGLIPASVGAAAETGAIRPFRVNIAEEVLVDLRRRLAATRWPDRETVADDSQGVPLATMQELVRYWDGLRLAQGRSETERPAAVHHRDRRAGHPLHPCPLEARERAAAHRHPRLARLNYRTTEDHRPADQPDGTRR